MDEFTCFSLYAIWVVVISDRSRVERSRFVSYISWNMTKMKVFRTKQFAFQAVNVIKTLTDIEDEIRGLNFFDDF